jgi:hypothetical protein
MLLLSTLPWRLCHGSAPKPGYLAGARAVYPSSQRQCLAP